MSFRLIPVVAETGMQGVDNNEQQRSASTDGPQGLRSLG